MEDEFVMNEAMIEEYLEEGETKANTNVILRMYELNFPLDLIANIVQIDSNEVQQILNTI